MTDPGSYHRMRGHRMNERGMTILELVIVIVIIGLMAAVLYTGVRYISKADLREDATEVASVLRAAYNMATTTGKHHRVVFDLDEQTYHIEMCEGDIKLHFSDREDALEKGDLAELEGLMTKGPGSTLPPELSQATSPEEATKAAAALAGTRLGEATCTEPRLHTGDADGRGAKRAIRTDRGLKIRGITVQHIDDEQTSGIVRINFFPLGRAEKAVVEIGDEDGNTYSLLVHGLTGRIQIEDKRVDPDDHMMRRADGEKVDER